MLERRNKKQDFVEDEDVEDETLFETKSKTKSMF